ncbi:hypothetical protein RV03_GL001798 [Enterococcus gallinarum]|nr:hypothetical protein RV03_GL001798 [Enterococcus gallinarum]
MNQQIQQVVITLKEWSQLFFSEIDYNRDASIFIFYLFFLK